MSPNPTDPAAAATVPRAGAAAGAPTPVDELIAHLAGDGPPGEPGRITMDREEARARLLGHRLAPDDQCLCELVQAAVLVGASRVVVWIAAGGIDLAFDGRAFTLAELEDRYGALLQATPTPEARALRQLALGLHAALVPGQWRLEVVTGDGQGAARLEIGPGQPDRLGPSDERILGTRIALRRPGALAAVHETLRREEPPEVAVLRERGRFAPIPVEVCGSRLSTGPTLAGAEGRVTLSHESVRVTAGLRSDAGAPAVLHVVQHGVVVASEPLDAPFPDGFQAVAEAEALRRDLSFTRVVSDDAFAAVLALVDRAFSASLQALADPEGARHLGPRARQVLRRALVSGRLPLTEAREALRLWDRLGPTGQRRRLSLGQLRTAAARHGQLQVTTRRGGDCSPETLSVVNRRGPCVVLDEPAEITSLAALLGVPVTRVDDSLGERQGTLSTAGMLRAPRVLAFGGLWLAGMGVATVVAHAHYGWGRLPFLALAVGLAGLAGYLGLVLLFRAALPCAFHRTPAAVLASASLVLPGEPGLGPWQRRWTVAWAVVLGTLYVLAACAVVFLAVRAAVSGGKPLGQTLAMGIASGVSTLLMATLVGGVLALLFVKISVRLIPATVLVLHARPLPAGLELRVPALVGRPSFREVRPWGTLADLEAEGGVSHASVVAGMEAHVAWTVPAGSAPITTFTTGLEQLRVAGAIRDWLAHQRARMLARARTPLPDEEVAVAASPCAALAVAGDRLVRGTPQGLWLISPALEGGSRLHAPGAPWLAVRALAASRDGTVLAAASEDGSLRGWQLPDPEAGVTRQVGLVHAVAVSDDGAVIAWGDEQGRLWSWRAPGRPRRLGQHAGPVTVVAWAGDHLLSGGVDGEVRATPPGGDPGVTCCRHAGVVRGLIARADVGVSGGDDGRVVAWRVADGRTLADHRLSGGVCALARDATGTRLAAADAGGGIRVLALPALRTVIELVGKGPAAVSLALLDHALVVADPSGLRRFTLPPQEVP